MVKTVAVFNNSSGSIQGTAHREPCAAQRVARWIDRRAQAPLANSIATDIHWVPGESGIPGSDEARRQANCVRDASGSTTIDGLYTSALNRGRRIAKGSSAAKAEWKADMSPKNSSYRLKGKTGTKRPVPMTSVK
jgi:hypothetical protein